MVIDVDGAFLTTDSDEDVIMELRGPLAELMCKIDPSLYRKFIATNAKGQSILYVKKFIKLLLQLRVCSNIIALGSRWI